MKTPREILMERHRAAEPRLDAVRRAVVENLSNQATKPQGSVFVSWLLRCSQNFWRELIWPSRRVWAGLATAWLLILVVNLNLKANAPDRLATNPSEAADFMMAFREQEQVLAELTQRQPPQAIEPRKRFVPRPRSDRGSEYFMI